MFPPGSIGFAHSTGALGRLIRLGEWMRFRKGSKYNHVFVIDRLRDGKCYVVQATLRGVTDSATLGEIAPGGSYTIVKLPPDVNRAKVLEFARRQVGLRYGYMTILAIALDIVTWDWVPAFRGARKQSWICSALGAESLRYGGWLHDWISIYDMTPAQLFVALSDQGS